MKKMSLIMFCVTISGGLLLASGAKVYEKGGNYKTEKVHRLSWSRQNHKSPTSRQDVLNEKKQARDKKKKHRRRKSDRNQYDDKLKF